MSPPQPCEGLGLLSVGPHLDLRGDLGPGRAGGAGAPEGRPYFISPALLRFLRSVSSPSFKFGGAWLVALAPPRGGSGVRSRGAYRAKG